MIKKFCLFLIILFLPIKVFANDFSNFWTWKNIKPTPVVSNKNIESEIDARSYAIYDYETGQIIKSKNINHTQAIASITKLMTVIVLTENYKQDEIIDVSYRAAYCNGSKMYLSQGEKISLKDLIKGMLISSANDAAIAIADYYGEEKIVGLMNKKAVELGLTNTKFSDTVGLDENNVSNARDLFIISKHILLNQDFREILNTINTTIVSASGQQHLLNTTNRLLKNYPDIFGIKTGYIEEAGFCLITLAEQKNHKIIVVLLGSSDNNYRFDHSRNLVDWAFQNSSW